MTSAHQDPTRRGPTFLVAGAGRAGTTALVQALRARSDVFVTDPKEPHYFAYHGAPPRFRGPGDEETINRHVTHTLDDYLALYPTTRPLALGEGSVSTLYHHERALPEILRVNPEMKIVLLLREPVARAYSSFLYLRAQGREPEEDFLSAVALEEERRAANWHHLWHYTAMSRYADAVAALRQALPDGHVGIWFHDDLETDHAGVVGEVERFLGLPEDTPQATGDRRGEPARVNVSGTPRSRRAHDALVWATSRPMVRHTGRALTTWRFREAVRTRLLRRGSVDEGASHQLAPLFADDLDRLRTMLEGERELPAWLAGRAARRAG